MMRCLKQKVNTHPGNSSGVFLGCFSAVLGVFLGLAFGGWVGKLNTSINSCDAAWSLQNAVAEAPRLQEPVSGMQSVARGRLL